MGGVPPTRLNNTPDGVVEATEIVEDNAIAAKESERPRRIARNQRAMSCSAPIQWPLKSGN